MEPPSRLAAIERATDQHGFEMASMHKTGALLRQLAVESPSASILELGTGTGIATCWLLDGMDATSRLETVDMDANVQAIACEYLSEDSRLTIVCEDAVDYLVGKSKGSIDLLFADAWPGKFSHLNQTLSLLRDGGIYIVDDLLPQPSWPENHAAKIPVFIEEVKSRSEFETVYWEWSTGILLARRLQ